MAQIYLVGFRGTLQLTQSEPLLIRLGHVGIEFENSAAIFGFRPTSNVVEDAGSEIELLRLLRERVPVSGALHDDTAVFERAYQLSLENSKTMVWRLRLDVEEAKAARIYKQAEEWYATKQEFPYILPAVGEENDNCATFPRRLGLEIAETTGHLDLYIPVLQRLGEPWKPRGK